jgi:hypothetical protein
MYQPKLDPGSWLVLRGRLHGVKPALECEMNCD